MYKIIDSYIHFPKKTYGEDRMFLGSNFCGVIDGATPIDKCSVNGYSTQAEWFAEMLKQELESMGKTEYFPDACKVAVENIKNRADTPSFEKKYNIPSATIAAVVENGKNIVGYVLCDSNVIVVKKSGDVVVLSDKRLEPFSKLTKQEKRLAIESGKDWTQPVLNQRIKNRLLMNTPSGYWVVSMYGDFEKEFVSLKFDKDEVDMCVVCTDRFMQICDMCGLNPLDVVKLNNSSDKISECVQRINAENLVSTDYVKRIDDIAFLKIIFREGTNE